MILSRHVIGWIGGVLTTLFTLGLIFNQIAFDSELLSTETRVMALMDSSDRRIIEQLLDTQRLLIGQQQQQFLTLRREIIDQQLAIVRHQYERGPKEMQAVMGERVHTLERKLEDIDKQLQGLLLKPKPMTFPDEDL